MYFRPAEIPDSCLTEVSFKCRRASLGTRTRAFPWVSRRTLPVGQSPERVPGEVEGPQRQRGCREGLCGEGLMAGPALAERHHGGAVGQRRQVSWEHDAVTVHDDPVLRGRASARIPQLPVKLGARNRSPRHDSKQQQQRAPRTQHPETGSCVNERNN